MQPGRQEQHAEDESGEPTEREREEEKPVSERDESGQL